MRIYLTGFMGCGKTFTARELSVHLGVKCFDLDYIIESSFKMSIPEIFMKYDEAYFRNLESDILFSHLDHGVYATGGGIIELQKNRDFLQNADNFVIWLNTDWDIILKRLSISKRPLLKDKNTNEIYRLYLSRLPKYQKTANLIVNNQNIQNIVQQLPSEFTRNQDN